ILYIQFISRGAGSRIQDKETFVFRQAGLNVPPGLLLATKDEYILRLWCAQFVIIHFMVLCSGRKFTPFWFVVTAVIESVISFPGDAGELQVRQGIFYHSFICCVDHNGFTPVRTTFGNEVRCL